MGLSRSQSCVENEFTKRNVVLYFESSSASTGNEKTRDSALDDVFDDNVNDDNIALSQTVPIVEIDEMDFGCSPTLPRRRKSSEKRKQTKTDETNDNKETKEQKKGFWFNKSENKTKTNDENSTTNENKTKFKKHHRKSKSVLVPPTYLNIDSTTSNGENDGKPTNNRKSSVGSPPKSSSLTRKLSFVSSPRNSHKRNTSVGNIPKESNKSEKGGLFRRFYSSHESKKNKGMEGGPVTSPGKRTRRHTQPVGDVQKEFMVELKGKLIERCASQYTVKTSNTHDNIAKDKVIWNMNI